MPARLTIARRFAAIRPPQRLVTTGTVPQDAMGAAGSPVFLDHRTFTRRAGFLGRRGNESGRRLQRLAHRRRLVAVSEELEEGREGCVQKFVVYLRLNA